MTRVLVTGVNGFIGTALCQKFLDEGLLVRGAFRSSDSADSFIYDIEKVIVGNIDINTDWHKALEGVDIVVHLAARVHVMHETAADPLAAFEEVNTAGTLNLAEHAAEKGVRRLLFLSTIKVNGEQTDKVYCASDKVQPTDPYALSKWRAELGLQAISHQSAMEVVIIRPPLVYGPQVKGNFLRLLKLIKKGLPLPFSSIKNSRSMVSIENLCALIKTCLSHPKADGEVFLVSDGQDLSTPKLIQLMGKAIHKSPRLFPFPVAGLYFIANLVSKRQEVDRLCGSLSVDIQKNNELLSWRPQYSVEDGIKKAAAAINSQHSE